MNKKKMVATLAAPLLLVGWLMTGTAQAADDTPQPGYGPGMMGGYGYGPGPGPAGGGYGYGPGMMGGGYGYGPGMMGGWGDDGRGWGRGYGPGMGGYGYGPGMMGGWGGMYGMMEPWWTLDLTDKQRTAIDNIMQAQHNARWPLMSRMFEAYGKLDQLYRADKWDGKAIGKAYDDLYKLQREMIDSAVDTHNRIMDQLTPEQREQLKRNRWQNRWHR